MGIHPTVGEPVRVDRSAGASVMYSVLVVEDHDRLREQLGRFYEQLGYRVATAACGEEAIQRLGEEKFALVVSDVKMPGIDGFELTRHVREKYPETDIILITAFGNVQQAVEAMKIGASDYITKPFQPEAIRLVSEKLIEKRRLLDEVRELRQRVQHEHSLENIVSKSPKMLKIFDLIRSLAETDSGVMITGETGTGKELVARAIHNLSRRRNRPFVAINCGAFPDTLLESELFGYEKGAFTGAVVSRAGKVEQADGGTLFLDEIETIAAPMQVTLLRVLQEREVERLGGNRKIKVDMRVIAASNVDLSLCLARGTLREDFYYRINVIPIHLPPLRERPEDFPILIQHILERHPLARAKEIREVAPRVLDQMLAYRWPGNVRELENILERAIVKCRGQVIEEVDLPAPPQRVADLGPSRNGMENMSLKQWLLGSEKDYLRNLLVKHRGSISLTAKEAKVDNKTLYRKMKKHGLLKESFKEFE
ncbi:MAG TPA: sigma-54 dependent transcriptional regulator [candidate division Zixibacteria bacterium]|nr:sigma-54 dependent transcriptional regulator [candidate division Zixibacteria bacterium]